jgi:hypothetical protein
LGQIRHYQKATHTVVSERLAIEYHKPFTALCGMYGLPSLILRTQLMRLEGQGGVGMRTTIKHVLVRHFHSPNYAHTFGQ